ncbi:cytosine/adenosine deaminase-related metal-dependent hydrolase [Methanofollis sp. W23]|uniref:amidohydrolase family protein n=1 Tax=Methanofollis sp. W23 TaxID=2817849 RepID=UPI001AE2E91D|nr:amidohydrolase family protein [Methanofollis sp. W23]MBP2145697.1 cytosine/adenosine deaminase-related metal-dependent hydrolase [Methanofollis sp. W23]
MPEEVYEGTILLGEGLDAVDGRLVVEDGVVTGIEEGQVSTDHWICPAFFNAHTHLGDTVAMDCATFGNLSDLVTPPDGLKHRILRATPRDRLVAGMQASLDVMAATGTAGFADFREGGPDGVLALREALEGSPLHPFILGRDGGEGPGDGVGISSVRDVADADDQVARARAAGKAVAFHAGEKDPDDIDEALAYDPDLLVHCTHATDRHLRAIADAGIPIAVCVRSNWTLGVTTGAGHPPLKKMLEFGCSPLLGTDNVMFVQPDMLSEMAFVETVTRLPPPEIMRAAVKGAELTGRSYFIEEGKKAHFTIINTSRSNLRFSTDPVASIVKRTGRNDLLETVINTQTE